MVDFPWSKYFCPQAELRDNLTVGDRSWGAEAGLNRISSAELRSHPHPVNDNDIDRAVSSGQRRERHRAALRRLYLAKDEASPDPQTFLPELTSVKAKVTKSDWDLLCAVATGRGYAEIAAAKGGTAGALRVRVSRLRREIA